MPENHLHIVSFDVPFPANYGGVIDVYYKLLALNNIGIKIHLHCFEYGRGQAEILGQICETVNYYPRKTGLSSNLSTTPYIVKSRNSTSLINNLIKDNYPILFEGLHTCCYMPDIRLKNRLKIYRESNIEHHYYMHLFRDEKSILKKLFFLIEAFRLKRFQKKLRFADLMLVVSQSDTTYLQEHFAKKKVVYLPSFHANNDFSVQPGGSDFVLYHGKLSVTENYNAAEYLIKEVFAGLDKKLVVAGMDPPEHLKKLCSEYPNVSLIANPDDEEMFGLIQNAQANILITFQATGLKLKLLNTLYKGRFCIVNSAMVQGTGLESLCLKGKNANDFQFLINQVFEKEFDLRDVAKRKMLLEKNYSNAANANRLADLIFGKINHQD
jgi:predicted nucleic acid-binding protein